MRKDSGLSRGDRIRRCSRAGVLLGRSFRQARFGFKSRPRLQGDLILQSVTYDTVLKALGYDESEARILSLLLDNKAMAADALIAESKLSRGKVYQVLKDLEGKGKIRSSNDRPSNFALADRFVVEVKDSVGKMYETINTRLAKVRPKEDGEVARDVCSAFESLGYTIADIPSVNEDILPEAYSPQTLFDYLVEDDYRFCVTIIDKTKSKIVHRLSDASGMLWFSMAASAIGCVDYFIFIGNFEGNDRLYNLLKGGTSKLDRTIQVTVPISPQEDSERFFGIEGQTPIIAKTTENFHEIVGKAVADVRNQRRLVQEQVNKVNSTLNDIERTILDAEVATKNISTRLGRDAFPPLKDFEEIIHLVERIREPIQSIAYREKRSLDLVKQDYMRLSLDMSDRISSFNRRVYLPQVDTVRKLDEKLARINRQFQAIGFEMKCLEREVFPRLYQLRVRSRKLSLVNPFVFTVPYEPGRSFAIGQNNLRVMFNALAERVSEGFGTEFRFLVGNEGSGKSHCLHNILSPILRERRIIPIIVDSPLKQDIVELLLDGILNATGIPQELQAEIRSIKTQRNFSSLRDLMAVIDQLVTTSKAHSYNGLALIIDEFENSLPRALNWQPGILIEPLSLRQLKELLRMDTPHFGIVVASRSGSFESFKNSLRIQNISEFTVGPDPFDSDDIVQLVQHRYDLWGISRPVFSQDALNSVQKRASGNPRNIIKYLRELYRDADYKGTDQVTADIVDAIGPIPIFSD
ncbi:hypothetical protein E6H33_07675 [Candidatus Bathyarchaeota archaeon]|nr:MAG: hypothetical protein E6H33_07675 [Candidatus Bathyarchaeota archaeon]